MPATGPKTVKSRVHLDLTSSATDRDQEIDRLLALGARRADIGQTGKRLGNSSISLCLTLTKQSLCRKSSSAQIAKHLHRGI